MTTTANRITVSSVPVQLSPATGAATEYRYGRRMAVKNTHATDTLVLGGAAVTAATGFALAAGATIDLDLGEGDLIFGIRGAAADVVAHVLGWR